MDGCTKEDEWEQCKENVQPLKGGRRINDLRKVLSSEENGYIKSTIQYIHFSITLLFFF